jgi:hypothetical protein
MSLRHLLVLALAVTTSSAAAVEEGFTELFNGKDLTGWEGDKELWSVADGAIVGQTTADRKAKHNTFLFWRGGVVADFELRFTARLAPGNNSGLQYRSKEFPDFVARGYQCDINAGPDNMCKLYEEGFRGRIAMPGEKVTMSADPAQNDSKVPGKKITGMTIDAEALKKIERKADWNEFRIVAQGNHLQHYLNGALIVDLTDEDEKKRAASGILALQIHAGGAMKIEFKDLRLKTLN